MKKIINSPETLVQEMNYGYVMSQPTLSYDKKYKVVYKKDVNKNKVLLISGGGSGHEPAHTGYIGKGMLDAGVCGDIFASPSQIQVYQAIKRLASMSENVRIGQDKGILLIIKNYSGDIMNFTNAMEMAKEDGINVDFVKVDDDIAVKDSLYTVGQRGVAGTVFVHKIAGAASERGYSLKEVKRLAEKTIQNTKTIGFALNSCTVPAKGTPTFTLAQDEIEYGIGIHSEPGIRREKMMTASEFAKNMTKDLFEYMNMEKGQEVVVLVNGFGATPLQELYVLNECVMKEIHEGAYTCVDDIVGNYMTSIDMNGASLTIMKVDDELKSLLGDEVITPALTKLKHELKPIDMKQLEDEVKKVKSNTDNEDIKKILERGKVFNNTITLDNFIYLIHEMSNIIIKNEVHFCEMDSAAGDGDFGMSIAKGFRQVLCEFEDLCNSKTIGELLDKTSLIVMEHCGGASGPIWGSAIRGASKFINDKKEIDIITFAGMLNACVKAIQKTGERSFGRGAVVGDKTLIDALIPCSEEWNTFDNNTKVKEAFVKGAKAAVDGAERTKEIVARMGRAGTVGKRSLGHPDAGAYGLGVIFTELSKLI